MEITTTMTRTSARVGHSCSVFDHLMLPVMPTAKGRIVPTAGFVATYATPTNVHRSATGSPPV
ncbi:MAG TPA: hypothetical protein PLX68_12010 [Dermatophilaceae bacterium]|nr:hypothetical protein [Dermatophilaceae bacterium]